MSLDPCSLRIHENILVLVPILLLLSPVSSWGNSLQWLTRSQEIQFLSLVHIQL